MKVTVFGATAATGQAIAEAALDAGHAVTVLSQEPSEFPLAHDRLRVLEGDVFDIPTVETAIRAADAVCAAFDEPLDQLPGTDLGDAMENVLAVLSRFQTSRIIVVTAANGTPEKPGLRARLTNLFRTHEEAETGEETEALVRASTADWTIVRPTRLTDGPATGDYRAGPDVTPDDGSLSRADLARFVVDHLDDDAYRHQVVTVAR